MMKNHQKGNVFSMLLQNEAESNTKCYVFDFISYYAFVESASSIPPKVRPPPYTQVSLECKDIPSKNAFVSVHNICGDLNKGQIPRNPMRQNVLGEPYPL